MICECRTLAIGKIPWRLHLEMSKFSFVFEYDVDMATLIKGNSTHVNCQNSSNIIEFFSTRSKRGRFV